MGMTMMAGDIIDLTQDDDQSRPNKRPRLTDSSEPKHLDKDRLLLVLKTQVIPHLHRALANIPNDCKKGELGAAVIRVICDHDFERAFHEGGGRLSVQVESQVADRVRHLVAELANNPTYRHANAAPKATLLHPTPPDTAPTNVAPTNDAPLDATLTTAASTTAAPIAPGPINADPTNTAPPNTAPPARLAPSSTYCEPSTTALDNALNIARQPDPVPKTMPIHGPRRHYMQPGFRETPVPPPVIPTMMSSHHYSNTIIPSIEPSNPTRNFARAPVEMSLGLAAHTQNTSSFPTFGRSECDPTNGLDDGVQYEDEDEEKNEDEDGEVDQNSVLDMDMSWSSNEQSPLLEESGSLSPPLPCSKRKRPAVTPRRLRALRRGRRWQQLKTAESEEHQSPPFVTNSWFGLSERPYLGADERRQIVTGTKKMESLSTSLYQLPHTLHVDFTAGEIQYLRYLARSILGKKPKGSRDADRDLRHMLKKDATQENQLRRDIVKAATEGYRDFNPPPSALRTRNDRDLTKFLTDLLNRDNNPRPKLLSLAAHDKDLQPKAPVNSLLSLREIFGNRPLALTRGGRDVKSAFRTDWEDQLEPKAEWTNCAGDIMTISWVSNAHFVCGAVTHSDAHNQQYNKAGNLLLGSVPAGSVRAYPDHRIPRPLVTHGDNSLNSMRESQSPWLYTSVVSSDYQAVNNLAFTSSFDHTVKVWKMTNEAMQLLETWKHEGRVNFVVASQHPDGMVATAADVPNNAVRVYHPASSTDIPTGSPDVYPCMRVLDTDFVPSEKWAYYPSAIRWGLGPAVRHLLLVGYSPRTLTDDEHDIPEEKLRTGELCLWDTKAKKPVKINNAASSNVFEVVWHPSLKIFAAATSASGLDIDQGVKTQIRLFQFSEDNSSYTAFKTLDCFAADINELSLRSNSYLHSFVAAGCTDGCVYVWDSGLPADRPFCVLQHGDPIEEVLGERETEDVGVKFVAWARTSDRLYTGSSDGVLKVWNIKHQAAELVKELVEVGGPITAGAFSPDLSRLVVGDGAGRITLLALEDDEDKCQNNTTSSISGGLLRPSDFLKIPRADGKFEIIRRPRTIIPHADPEPPEPPLMKSTPNTELTTCQNTAEGPYINTPIAGSEGLPHPLKGSASVAASQAPIQAKMIPTQEGETMKESSPSPEASLLAQRGTNPSILLSLTRQPHLILATNDRELHMQNQERELRLTEPEKLQLQVDKAEHPSLGEIDYTLEYEYDYEDEEEDVDHDNMGEPMEIT